MSLSLPLSVSRARRRHRCTAHNVILNMSLAPEHTGCGPGHRATIFASQSVMMTAGASLIPSLVCRLSLPSYFSHIFFAWTTCKKSWAVEPGNEARAMVLETCILKCLLIMPPISSLVSLLTSAKMVFIHCQRCHFEHIAFPPRPGKCKGQIYILYTYTTQVRVEKKAYIN